MEAAGVCAFLPYLFGAWAEGPNQSFRSGTYERAVHELGAGEPVGLINLLFVGLVRVPQAACWQVYCLHLYLYLHQFTSAYSVYATLHVYAQVHGSYTMLARMLVVLASTFTFSSGMFTFAKIQSKVAGRGLG